MTRQWSAVGPDERGSALVGVLVLLMMMSALAAALGVSGHTETLVARNHQSSAQAEAAAEAGLNHALQVTIDNIRQWDTNGFADVDTAIAALLLGPDGASGTADTDADNGSLGAFGIPIGARVDIPGGFNAQYEARMMDEDDPARGVIPAVALIAEDGNPLVDANNRLVIRAVGYGQDNTSVVLEALIGPALQTGRPSLTRSRAGAAWRVVRRRRVAARRTPGPPPTPPQWP